MAKLSVYIPDELWSEARKGSGEKKNSQIIQEALQRQIDEGTAVRSGLAVAGELVDAGRFRGVLESVRSDYQAEYRRGYEAGLDLIDQMGFWLLQIARSVGFDPVYTLDAIGKQEDEDLDRELERLWNELDPEDDGQEVFRDGVGAAFRDLWSALREGQADALSGETESETRGEGEE